MTDIVKTKNPLIDITHVFFDAPGTMTQSYDPFVPKLSPLEP